MSNDAFEEEIVIGQADIEEETVHSVEGAVLETGSDSVQDDQDQEVLNMPDPDPAIAAEVDRLEDIKDDVELSLSDMPVSRVSVQNMEVLKQRISDTHKKAKEYALGMTKMGRKFPSLEDSFKLQYAADGKALLRTVSEHEDLLLNKMHGLSVDDVRQPSQHVPGVAQPGTVPQLPQVPDPSAAAATLAKAAVKYTILLNMALSAKQDAEEDGLYLETASDEKISRLVQKVAKYEKSRDKIQNCS